MKVQRIKAIIYHAYFESLYQATSGDPESYNQNEGRVMSCIVIAANVQEALAKIQHEFPSEVVSAIHSEREYRGAGQREVILL